MNKIGFLGAGKVGTTLGKYFAEHSVEVAGYYSRSISSASEAAAFTGSRVFETARDVLAASDVLFLPVLPCPQHFSQSVFVFASAVRHGTGHYI